MSDAMVGDIVDRLRGRYPIGPKLANGQPEFGWKDEPYLLGIQPGSDRDQSAVRVLRPSIMEEAAREIEKLRLLVNELESSLRENG